MKNKLVAKILCRLASLIAKGSAEWNMQELDGTYIFIVRVHGL